MKHTMKKLLCMALAIMLLVSAVPVFAAADGFTATFQDPSGKVVGTHDFPDAANWDNEGAVQWVVERAIAAGDLPAKYNQSATLLNRDNNIIQVSKAAETVYVTFKTSDGTVVGSWSYSDEIGEPDWNASGAAGWAMSNAGLSYDHAEVQDDSDPYNAMIKVYNDAPVVPEKEVVVTFRLPDGSTKTWSYKPSAYATENNNGGAPDWTENAAAWAMNEAVKANVLSKKYDNVQLLSVSPDSYAATIKVSDKVTTPSNPTTPVTDKITVTIKIGTTVKVDAQPYNAESATINELIRNWNSGWYDDYMLTSYKVGSTTVTAPKTSDVIYAGQTVTINLSKREKEALHDKLSDLKPVILHVYLNNNFNAEDEHYTITSIAEDGTLDLNNDVKKFLQNYYTAKTSDGITYDGMYVADGYFGVKYLADEKYVVLGNDADETGNTTLDRMRSEGYVHLNVMLTNAKAKSTSSSSTADSSNPKTGDTIFVPVMVMGLTASALAAAYVIGKKRFAR